MKYSSITTTIEAVSDKPEQKTAAIKADGKWFNIWRDFQGATTDEYNQLKFGNHNGPFNKGDVVTISYKEGSYNGRPQYTVKSLFPADSSQITEKPQNGANLGSESTSDEKFWDRKGYEKCAWTYFIAKGGDIDALKEALEINLVWDAYQLIKTDADKRYATGMEKARAIFSDGSPVPEELPVIQQDDDVDGIPF